MFSAGTCNEIGRLFEPSGSMSSYSHDLNKILQTFVRRGPAESLRMSVRHTTRYFMLLSERQTSLFERWSWLWTSFDTASVGLFCDLLYFVRLPTDVLLCWV